MCVDDDATEYTSGLVGGLDGVDQLDDRLEWFEGEVVGCGWDDDAAGCCCEGGGGEHAE